MTIETPSARSPSTGGPVTYTEIDFDDDYSETKAFFRTSEFWVFLLFALGALLAAYSSGDDSLSREDGWRYATAVVAAYVLSRGIAKAGTREPKD